MATIATAIDGSYVRKGLSMTAEPAGTTERSDGGLGGMPGHTERAARFVRRVPFTLGVVGMMMVLGVATGSLWSPLQDRPLFEVVAYGLPSLEAGRWWTPVTGSFFALIPAQYLPVAGGALLLVGWSEWRLGTRRVAIVAVSAQLVGVLGASLFLLAFRGTGWEWAQRLAETLDVGFSAGALGAVAAASATVSPPWRGRIRLLLVGFATIALLYIGLLWDLEHFFAVLFGLALGPVLLGGRPRFGTIRLSRHEWRIIASVSFVLIAVVNVLLFFVPSDGPLGATSSDSDAVIVLINAAISLVIAWSLRRGSRRAWYVAMVVTSLVVAAGVLLVFGAIVAAEELEAEGGLGSSTPEFVVTLLLSVVQLWVLIAGRSAFRARSRRKRRAALAAEASDRGTAIALLKQHGGSTMSWMATWVDNLWFIHHDSSGVPDGFVAFQSHRGVAIALGDPVAADAATRAAVLTAFVHDEETRGLQVCFFSVTEEVADWGRTKGQRAVLVAQEAVIDLEGLEFKGKSWQSVRTSLNRAAKDGIVYRQGRLAEMPRGLVTQVRAISELWVSDKGLPEMGFTLGGVDEALDPDTLVGLAVDADMTVHGVTSWLPVYGPGGAVHGWTLDVMRRLPDGFRPVTEFLIASACLTFRESGFSFVSLSGAPLAHSGDRTAERVVLERLLDQLGEAMEPLYGFRSLDGFKQKFRPRHEPVYLVYSDESALPRIGLALTAAYLPSATLRDLAKAGLSASRDAA
jgi:phosphatidylglycerol lysyltransferase